MSVAPVKRRYRPTKVDRLPTAIKERIANLRRNSNTIDEIIERLREEGFTGIARTQLATFTRLLDISEGRVSPPPEAPATATAATAEPPPEVEYAPSPGAAGAAPTSPAGGEVGERPSFGVRLVKIRPKLRLVGPLAGTEA